MGNKSWYILLMRVRTEHEIKGFSKFIKGDLGPK